MTDPAAIVTAVRAAIDLLTDHDNPGLTAVAGALDGWLRGVDLEAGLGLVGNWRAHHRLTARNRALGALVEMNGGMSARRLAAWIREQLPHVPADDTRPDGAAGHVFDLARAGCPSDDRHLRKLIAAVRGGGASRRLNAPRHR